MKQTHDPFLLTLNQQAEAAVERRDWGRFGVPTNEEVKAELERRRNAKGSKRDEVAEPEDGRLGDRGSGLAGGDRRAEANSGSAGVGNASAMLPDWKADLGSEQVTE